MIPDLATALAATESEGRRLFDACEATPEALVRACPGWTNTDLAIHTTGVYRRVAHWCTIRATKPERWPDHEPPDPVTPWAWCRDGLDLVLAALGDIGAEEAVWSWTDRRDGGFYHRRMVHESVVHRWDAESAAGSPGSIDPEIAADGVDEITAVGLRFRGDGTPIEYPDGDVLLIRSDGAQRWRLRAMDGTLQVARGGDTGTSAAATVAGTAEDLLLYMWNRATVGVNISGDESVAEKWGRVAP
jgi:uncharacterized protein (TIGR03083 family)